MKRILFILAGTVLFFAACPSSYAKNAIVALDSRGITTKTFEGNTYYVVDLIVPEDVIGKRLDAVLLEFFVDVANDDLIDGDYQTTVEVFPLLEPAQEGVSPRFDKSFPTTRPVTIGRQQQLTFDITEIVKGWIAEPTNNHGLIIGSFSEPRAGGVVVRNDLLGGGKTIQATFFYQNRFGRRSK